MELMVRLSGVTCPQMKDNAPEPYAREARFFAEQFALNRSVLVRLDGADKYGNLFASVLINGKSLSEELLGLGVAKIQDHSLPVQDAERLRAVQASAQEKQLRLWHGFVPKPVSAAGGAGGAAAGAKSAPACEEWGWIIML